jgi:endogenous inhibitor of DNA gyrase (YacG/DUF329 family)
LNEFTKIDNNKIKDIDIGEWNNENKIKKISKTKKINENIEYINNSIIQLDYK